ncbi:MAG: hypothetical protein NTY93_02605, partial [Candidatus Kaiserbacteria bacterium]|nr:hypothetical protein [Candidatus Kaiserbacteria bacterium]
MESADSKLFQVHFGVDSHEVSVVTAVASLMSVADILKEVGISAGEERVDVSIYAPERGSVIFNVLVGTIPAVTTALSAIKTTIDYAKTLIDIVDIAKFLKGEKPKTITLEARNGSTITNISDVKGNVYVINGDVKLGADLLASNPLVQRSVKTLGEAAKRDSALNSLSFSYKEEEHSIAKEEFEYLEKAGEETEEIQEETIFNAMLTIIRPSFLQNLKSDFYYQGFK